MGLEARKNVVGVCVQQKGQMHPRSLISPIVFFLFKKYRIYTCYERNSNILGRFCSRECWFVNDQIGNPGDKIFSRRCPYKAKHDRKCFCCMKSTNTYIVDQSV